jgi:myo-inositol-1(or 4)-monophosphatase
MDAYPRYSGTLDPTRAGEFAAFVAELAEAAAQAIRPHYLSGIAPDLKSDASPVTAADREAEQAMRDLIVSRYPGHGILGEEFGLHQKDAEYRWVLDPIDGTQAFVANCYLFGTLIALTHEGRPVLGALRSPLTGHLLMGDGQRAWLGERQVHVRPCDRIEDSLLLATDHWDMFRYRNGPAFDALSRRVRLYRGWGDCHGYFQIATGGADIMVDARMKDWDIMALVPIVEGAGGRVSDWEGRDPVGSDSLVASGVEIHDALIEALNREHEASAKP